MVSAQRLIRFIDVGSDVRRPPLVGKVFYTNEELRPACRPRRTKSKVSSAASLVNLCDRIKPSPAAAFHCMSSRRLDCQR
jgi:hypothetical protein